MPTVPVLNETSVSDQPLPQARLSADAPVEAFGGGAGAERVTQSAENLENTAGEIYDRHQALADQMFAQQATAQFTNIKNNLLYNSDDGLQTQKGQNAFSAPEVFGQRYKDATDQILDSATTDRQRAILRNINARTSNQFNAAVQKHVYAETQAFDKETTDAGISAAINDGVNNYTDKGQVADSASTISHNIELYGQRQGYSDDQIKVQKALALSKLYGAVIERTADNGEDLVAQNMFDQFKSSMTSEQIEQSEKLLNTASTRGESQRNTQAILSSTSDEATAIAKAKAIVNPKVQDETVQRLRDEFNMREQEKRQRQEAASDHANQIINNGGSFNDIPPSVLAGMTPSAQKGAADLWRFRAQGVEPPNNWTKYSDLTEMASNPNTRQQFINTDPMSYRGQLDNAHFGEMVKLRAGMIKGDAAADGKIGEVRTNTKVISDSLANAKIPYPGKSSSERAVGAQFSQQFTQSLSDYEQSTGKKATDEEKQKVADKLLMSLATQPGWLGTSIGNGAKRAFQYSAADIPSTELPKIDQFLNRRGIPINDKTRLQQYMLKLNAMNNGQ